MSTRITNDDECPTTLLSPGQIIGINPMTGAAQITPRELFIIPEGTVKDEPSFAFIMKDRQGFTYVAQISYEKMLPAIEKAAEILAKKRGSVGKL